jgi:hypothetical protein
VWDYLPRLRAFGRLGERGGIHPKDFPDIAVGILDGAVEHEAMIPHRVGLAGRIELGDPALHPVLVAEALLPLAGRVGQLVVSPDRLEGPPTFISISPAASHLRRNSPSVR